MPGGCWFFAGWHIASRNLERSAIRYSGIRMYGGFDRLLVSLSPPSSFVVSQGGAVEVNVGNANCGWETGKRRAVLLSTTSGSCATCLLVGRGIYGELSRGRT